MKTAAGDHVLLTGRQNQIKDVMLLSRFAVERATDVHALYSLVCLFCNMHVINNLHPATNITSPYHSLCFVT